MRTRAFTLVEVLAALLLVAIGIASVVALLRAGVKRTAVVQAQALQQITATSLVHAALPVGTSSMALQDGKGWAMQSSTGSMGAASYSIVHHGYINGFYAVRSERSHAADIMGKRRWAEVQVELYTGMDGSYVTTVRQRILRRMP